MTKPNFILITIILMSLQISGQTSHILFDKNSDIITSYNKSRLDSFIVDIKKNNEQEVLGLSGHTDSDASDEYNKILSLRRAVAVKDFLIAGGLKNQIHIDSKGESEQLNNNKTQIDKAKNRRVEIVRNYSKNNFAFNNFDREFQIYTINFKNDTLLKCKLGSQIEINKEIFQTTDSSAPITIKIQEYYLKNDFVLSNLTTQDLNNNILESRGMINIEAFQSDKKLELKRGKSIGILFKDKILNDKTELFNGIKHNNEIAWVNSSRTIIGGEISGSSSTKIGEIIIESSKWKYEDIGGESFKIIETTKDGKTIHDTVSTVSEKLTKDLVLRSTKLGWINCDRFYKDDSPKIDLIVKYSGAFVPNLVIVFKDINSVLPYSYREDNKLIFKNIPSDQSIVLIGIFQSKSSNKILFAQKNTKSNAGLIETITFEELSAYQVEQKMHAL